MGDPTSSFISCADIIHFITKSGVGDSAQIRTRNNSCHDDSCVMTKFGGQQRRFDGRASVLLRVKRKKRPRALWSQVKGWWSRAARHQSGFFAGDDINSSFCSRISSCTYLFSLWVLFGSFGLESVRGKKQFWPIDLMFRWNLTSVPQQPTSHLRSDHQLELTHIRNCCLPSSWELLFVNFTCLNPSGWFC